MNKHIKTKKPLTPAPHKGDTPLSITEIARHIAVLVVRQHRMLKSKISKKNGENAL